jgi:hypothetical protein
VTCNGGGIGPPSPDVTSNGGAGRSDCGRQAGSGRRRSEDDLRVVPSVVDHAQLPSFEAETAIFTVSALKSGGFFSTAREEPAACRGSAHSIGHIALPPIGTQLRDFAPR